MPTLEERIQARLQTRSAAPSAPIEDRIAARLRSRFGGSDTSSLATDGTPGPAFREEQDAAATPQPFVGPPIPPPKQADVYSSLGPGGMPYLEQRPTPDAPAVVGPPPASSMFDAAANAAGRIVPNVIAGVDTFAHHTIGNAAEGLSWIEQQVGILTPQQRAQYVASLNNRYAQRQAQMGDAAASLPTAPPEDATGIQRLGYQAAEFGGGIAPYLAAGGVGPAVALGTVSGTGSAATEYQRELEGKGMDPARAAQLASYAAPLAGAVEGVVNAVQAEKIASRLGLPADGVKRWVAHRALDAAIGAGLSAGSDAASQAGGMAIGAQDGFDLNRSLAAIQSGAVGQSVMGAVSDAVGRLAARPATPEVEATTRAGTPGIPPAETGTPAGVSGPVEARDGIVPVTSAEALDAARAIRERQAAGQSQAGETGSVPLPPEVSAQTEIPQRPEPFPPGLEPRQPQPPNIEGPAVGSDRAFRSASSEAVPRGEKAPDDSVVARKLDSSPDFTQAASTDAAIDVPAIGRSEQTISPTPLQKTAGVQSVLLDRTKDTPPSSQPASNPKNQTGIRSLDVLDSSRSEPNEEPTDKPASKPANTNLSSVTSLDSMTPAQLRREAKARGVDSRGTKAQLLERLTKPDGQAPTKQTSTANQPSRDIAEKQPSIPPSPSPEGTAGANLETRSGPLSASPNPTPATDVKSWDDLRPGMVVNIYRGEGAGTAGESVKGGNWWTFNPEKAKKYGKVTSVAVDAESLAKHSAQGASGKDEVMIQGGLNKLREVGGVVREGTNSTPTPAPGAKEPWQARTPAKNEWTTGNIERRLKDRAEVVPEDLIGSQSEMIDWNGEPRPIHEVNMSFSGPLPGEIRDIVDNDKALRRMFRENTRRIGDTGEDWMAAIGADRMVELAREQMERGGVAGRSVRGRAVEVSEKRLAQMRSVDPSTDFLLGIHERTKEYGEARPDFRVVDNPAETLPDGADLRVVGKEFTVEHDQHGGRNLVEIDGGRKYPLAELDSIPVDAGSLVLSGNGKDRVQSTAVKSSSKPWLQETTDVVPKSIADQIVSRLDKIAADAEERIKTRPGVQRGKGFKGSRSGETTIIADVVDYATVVAARAIKAGIQGGQRLTALVSDTMKELGGAADRDHVRRIARGLIRDTLAEKPENHADAFERAAGALRDKYSREPKASEIKPLIRENTGQAPQEKTITESQALKASIKAADRTARIVDRQARDEERANAATTIRGLREKFARQRGMDQLEARADKEGAVQTVRGRQELADAIRAETLRVANTMPAKVRGALTSSIANATTPSKMIQVLRQLETRLHKSNARTDYKRVLKLTSEGVVRDRKGMTQDGREILRAIRKEASNAITVARTSQNLNDLRAASVMMTKLRDQASALLDTQGRVVRRQSALRAMSADEKVIQSQTKMRVDGDTASAVAMPGLADKRVAKIWEKNRKFWDFRSMVEKIEGVDGPLTQVWHDLEAGDDSAKAILRDQVDALDKAAARAGFKNYEDARSVMNGLDKKRSQTLTVRLDGKNRELTLGQAIGLYAHGTDPDTIRLIKSGEQKFAARGAETQALPMSESELLALSAAIDPKYRKLVDDIKGIMEQTRDAQFKVRYDLTGVEPEPVEGRWPRPRDMSGVQRDAIPEDPTQIRDGLLENAGRFESRVQTTSGSILFEDPITTALREFEASANIIGLGRPVRDAANVILDKNFKADVTKRLGKDLHQNLVRQLIAVYSPPKSAGGIPAFLSTSSAVGILGINPGAWWKQIASLPRLNNSFAARDIAAGLAAVKAGKVPMERLTKASGYFWDRDRTNYSDRMSGIVPGAKARGWAQKSLDILNYFDGLVSRAAFATAEAKARRKNPGASEAEIEAKAIRDARLWVRENANGKGAIDASVGATEATQNGGSFWYLFSSDAIKTRNRISRAFRRGTGEGVKVLARETASVYLGYLGARAIWDGFSMAIAAAYGWDDDDAERFAKRWTLSNIALAPLKDFADTVVPLVGKPALELTGFMGRGMTGQTFSSPAQDTAAAPIVELGRALRTSFNDEANTAKVLTAWAKFANETAATAGVNPFAPVLRRMIRELEAEAKE